MVVEGIVFPSLKNEQGNVKVVTKLCHSFVCLIFLFGVWWLEGLMEVGVRYVAPSLVPGGGRRQVGCTGRSDLGMHKCGFLRWCMCFLM